MEEEIIRKRLLTQTAVGHKGAAPLTKLARHYLELCEKAQAGASADEVEALHSQLLRDVANMELLAQKQESVQAAYRQEQAAFVGQREDMDAKIVQAREGIEQRKRELETARQVRQNREEYEALRALVVEHPRCSDMEGEIAKEAGHRDEALAAGLRAARTVELRKKQFALLIHTITSLTSEMNEAPLDAMGGAVTAMETD